MKKIISLVFTLLAIVTNINGKDFLPIIEEGNEYDYYWWCDEYRCYYTLKLEGDSLHNGDIYKNCSWDVKKIDNFTGNETNFHFTNGLVREENGKVWMLYNLDIGNCWLPYYYGSTKTELLIYNMNLDVNEDLEVVPSVIDTQDHYSFFNILWYRGGRFKLMEKKTIMINNEERLVQKFASQYEDDDECWFTIEVIEGIGAFDHLLLFPYTKDERAAGGHFPAQLLEKRNAKGEVVYKREWYANAPTYANPQVHVIGGDDEIIIEGEYSHWSVTDISGRTWNTLKVPAGLYIVNVDGAPHKIIVK